MAERFTVTTVGATSDLLSNLAPGFNARDHQHVTSWQLRSLGTSTDFTPIFDEASGHEATTVNGSTSTANIAGVDDWQIDTVGAGFIEVIGLD